MNEESKRIKKRSSNLKKIIDELKKIGNFKGVALISRTGTLISKNIDFEFNEHIFSAMCASVIESSEIFGRSISQKKMNKIITEFDNQSIILIGTGKDSFIVLFTDDNSKVEFFLNNFDKYHKKIDLVY